MTRSDCWCANLQSKLKFLWEPNYISIYQWHFELTYLSSPRTCEGQLSSPLSLWTGKRQKRKMAQIVIELVMIMTYCLVLSQEMPTYNFHMEVQFGISMNQFFPPPVQLKANPPLNLLTFLQIWYPAPIREMFLPHWRRMPALRYII